MRHEPGTSNALFPFALKFLQLCLVCGCVYVCAFVNRTTFRDCIFNVKSYWIEQTYGRKMNLWKKAKKSMRKSEKFFYLLFLIINSPSSAVVVGWVLLLLLLQLSHSCTICLDLWNGSTQKMKTENEKINKKTSTQRTTTIQWPPHEIIDAILWIVFIRRM